MGDCCKGYHKRSSPTMIGITLAHMFIYHFVIWAFKVTSKIWKPYAYGLDPHGLDYQKFRDSSFLFP